MPFQQPAPAAQRAQIGKSRESGIKGSEFKGPPAAESSGRLSDENGQRVLVLSALYLDLCDEDTCSVELCLRLYDIGLSGAAPPSKRFFVSSSALL